MGAVPPATVNVVESGKKVLPSERVNCGGIGCPSMLQITARALEEATSVLTLPPGETGNGPAFNVDPSGRVIVSVTLKRNGIKNRFVLLDVTKLKFTALFVVSRTVPIWITAPQAPTWRRKKVAVNQNLLERFIWHLRCLAGDPNFTMRALNALAGTISHILLGFELFAALVGEHIVRHELVVSLQAIARIPLARGGVRPYGLIFNRLTCRWPGSCPTLRLDPRKSQPRRGLS